MLPPSLPTARRASTVGLNRELRATSVAPCALRDKAASLLSNQSSDRAAYLRYSTFQRSLFVVVLFLATTSNYADYFILSVVLEPIKREFNVSDSQLGLLTGFGFAVLYAVSGLALARIADHGNRRNLIVWSLVGWSLMTINSGFARTFGGLVFSRLGVAVLEPGNLPAAQSLVIDYFPPEKRAFPLAFLSVGANSVGYLMGVSGAGLVAAEYGWRAAFVFAGTFGLAVAVLGWTCLREPRRMDSHGDSILRESFGKAMTNLLRKRSFILFVAGSALSTTFGSASSIFVPSFMARSLHASLADISIKWGIVIAGADLLGALSGAWISQFLGNGNVRWFAVVAGTFTLLSAPLYAVAFSASSMTGFIVADAAAEFTFSMAIPAVLCVLHAICGSARRGTALAFYQLTVVLVGFGFGPMITGSLSDALQGMNGNESLRMALFGMVLFIPASAGMFLWGTRHIPSDCEI